MPQDLWRALFENALEGMLLATPDGTIIAANPAACRMFGRNEEELRQLGRSPETVVMNEAFKELAERRKREGHARGNATLRRGDGSTFTADMSGVAFEGPNGPRVHIMLIDVTEQLRTHRALEILAKAGRVLGESLDVTATLKELMSLVVPDLADLCALDILDNEEIRRMVVAHRDPTKAELVRVVRRRGAQNRAGVEYVLRTGKPQLVKKVTDEFARASTHDDTHFEEAKQLGVTSFVSVPLVARGRTLGAFTLASTGGVPPYDEYDLALASALGDQAALAVANAGTHDASVQATRLRDEVLEVVSHDLKNPLNTIKLSAGSLARRVEAEEIPVLLRAVARAEQLIQDLLDVSKMEFGTIALDRKPTSLRAIVDGVLALHKDAAAAKGIDLGADVVGEEEVDVDSHRIAQMLDNLVGNAIKFTQTGSVEVRARVTPSTLVIEVHDTGPGMAPDVLPHVFDRFWQSAHAGRAGAGLGLAIASGIAKAHGGDLTVESTLGQGTTFTATLPIAT